MVKLFDDDDRKCSTCKKQNRLKNFPLLPSVVKHAWRIEENITKEKGMKGLKFPQKYVKYAIHCMCW
mgnify:CR=1 FL=1